jgi:ABC-2 type transport system ATP-binding protein
MIRLTAVTKYFKKKPVVYKVSLSIEKGEVFGFIGPNGAGKTTTIKMMTTLLTPDFGLIFIGGCSTMTAPHLVRRKIGYVPDEFGLYPDMTVEEYMNFSASLMDVETKKRKKRIAELLDLLGLSTKHDTELHGLSKGMKNRLYLARALVHDPPVLILDEPASGLDPRARIEFRDIIKLLASMGKTIFISSHILSEMDELCSRVAIIDKGRIVFSDTVENLAKISSLEGQVKTIDLKIAAEEERAIEFLKQIENVRSIARFGDGFRIELTGGAEEKHRLLRELVEQGLAVSEFVERKTSIEDVYLRITRGNVE